MFDCSTPKAYTLHDVVRVESIGVNGVTMEARGHLKFLFGDRGVCQAVRPGPRCAEAALTAST
jgi:hypothetical protein